MNKSKQLLLFTTLVLSLALSSCSLKLIDDYD